MNSKIEMIPSYKIAYMRSVGPYGPENARIMEQLKKWAQSNHLFDDDTILLGIAQDNPSITKPEECRYDTCLVISNHNKINKIVDDSMMQGHITGGKYIVFKIIHTEEAVQKAWGDIFPELINHHYKLDPTRPILERYKAQMVKNHLCEICVPVD